MDETIVDEAAAATGRHEQGATAADDLLEDELLVEEISIDGMCGVY